MIDGRTLRVPNWLTFPFVIAGLIAAFARGGTGLLLLSLAGALVGLLTLLPLYSIGGMGAGDVKLMAGLGAWIGPWFTLWAFVATSLMGTAMAVAMMLHSGKLYQHLGMIQTIGREVLTLKSPTALAERAAIRKPTMVLLPYGIPIAAGTIAYLVLAGFLI
jgi:prepilin peptidase CpaA